MGIPGIVLWISTSFQCIFVWFTGSSSDVECVTVLRTVLNNCQMYQILCKWVHLNRNNLYCKRSLHFNVILCNLVILIISHVSHVPNGFWLMGISP